MTVSITTPKTVSMSVACGFPAMTYSFVDALIDQLEITNSIEVVDVDSGEVCMTITCDCDSTLRVYRNRYVELSITLTGLGDITSAKIWFSVKTALDDTDEEALISKKTANNGGSDDEVVVTDGPNGVLKVYINPGDTLELSEGDFWFDLVVYNTQLYQAIRPSRFRIIQPATLAEMGD